MDLFQIIGLLDSDVVPEKCKIHLAGWNGSDDPLDVYLSGDFDEWQSWQSKRNFERSFVVSLINISRDSQWLFVGVYDSNGCEWVEKDGMNLYHLNRRPAASELEGRLIVRFERTGRQSYLLGENWSSAINVVEIRPEKMQIAAFPGYSSTMLTKQHLDIIVRQEIESWRSALANVAGVYVIADRHTGKLYIGSATGVGGIWSRWCAYSWTGHGNNVELIALLGREGASYAENFQYGVLEIADTHASADEILRRESHWKDILCSRVPHGYNAN
jgi:hypothetical protein